MNGRAVITGAAGGLGRAFVWEFAARGWDLFLTDVDERRLAAVASGVSCAFDCIVEYVGSDLSNEHDRRTLIQAIAGGDSPCNALVNVAGFDHEGAFLRRDWYELSRLMRVNMEAGIQLTHSLAGTRLEGSVFRVINTASLAAFFPMPYKALYAASKGFVLSVSLALQEELNPAATITVLCPAGMPTTQHAIRAVDAQGFLGRITTMNTSDVARIAYEAAMRGKGVVVPGVLNRVLLGASRLFPPAYLASAIGRRWAAVNTGSPGNRSETVWEA